MTFEPYKNEDAVRYILGGGYHAADMNFVSETPVVTFPNYETGVIENLPGDRMLIVIEGKREHMKHYQTAMGEVFAEHASEYRR